MLGTLFVSGCKLPLTIRTPPDVPGCVETIPDEEGMCFNLLSNKEFLVNNTNSLFNGRTWLQVKTKSIIFPAQESYRPLKAWILDECHVAKNCGNISGKLQKVDILFN